MKALVVLVGLAACAHPNAGSFVQSATIEGFDLVVTECVLSTEDQQIVAFDCTTKRQRLPVIAVPAETASSDSPGLDAAEVAEGVAPVRSVVDQCAHDRGIEGLVKIRIAIAPNGHVSSAVPNTDRDGYGSCLATAFGEARFPKTRKGAQLTFSVGAP